MKREHTPRRFDHCLELEARATRIQEFSATVMPGLLQTPSYMRALFRKGHPGASTKEIDSLVGARLGRQEVLRSDTPPDAWSIIGEAALRQAVGGAGVMREQLAALLPLAETRHTTIQVVAFKAGACTLMSGTLILLTLPDNSTTVYQEGPRNGEIFDDRETVMQRVREYDLMKASALPPQESWALIKATMETYEPCESPRT
ncbi:DUF5753 domain-containing protein [Streptomyces flavalbus]|uniref:DUF5753 domain-containing protein n=1 Tax=Streptomyces flavalbus TaxID=2665155 RepID=A0ABW2WFR2_9ACTN